MTPTTTRPAVFFAAALALALAGCGKTPETAKNDPAKGATPGPTTAAPVLPAGAVAPTDASSVAAENFAKSLVSATADPTKLSPAFLKAVGLPVVSPEDKAKGFSTAAAQAWLTRAGAALAGIAPPTGFTAGNTAVFHGPAGNGTGRYLIRMVQADGGWKVDWFGIGAAKANEVEKPKTSDEAFQDFAVLAFLDAISGTATPLEDRIPLAAAVLSAKAREAWATPFPADKDQGYDYTPGKLGGVMDGLGKGATAVTRTRTGSDSFKVEITKGTDTATYAVKLVPAAGGWVIDEFQRQ